MIVSCVKFWFFGFAFAPLVVAPFWVLDIVRRGLRATF